MQAVQHMETPAALKELQVQEKLWPRQNHVHVGMGKILDLGPNSRIFPVPHVIKKRPEKNIVFLKPLQLKGESVLIFLL